jgi:recombination protein RecA
MSQLNKRAGEGTIVLASDVVVPRRFTSGDLALDVALGGGFAGNQWTELIGNESSGKTLVALNSVAANQKADPEFTTFWCAAEPYNTEYAEMIGVDNARVVVAPAAQAMELGLELVEFATASKLYDCVVLDSYPALIPDEEYEKSMDEFVVGTGAKLFNKFWRKAGKVSYRKSDGSEKPFYGIVINQFRDKIGGFSPRGVPQTSPGGHGKDYAFYTRLKIQHKEYKTEKRPGVEKPVTVGKTVMVTTMKNKSTAPEQKAEFDFYFRNAPFSGHRRGEIDFAPEYISLGKLFGVIGVRGSWLDFDGMSWKSKADMEASLLEDLTLREKLRDEVLEYASDPRLADEIAQQAADEAETKRKR